MPGPYLIAEAYCRHSEVPYRPLGTLDGKLHLLPSERATRTLCDRRVANGTMIPLEAWHETDGQPRCSICQNRRDRAAEEVGHLATSTVTD